MIELIAFLFQTLVEFLSLLGGRKTRAAIEEKRRLQKEQKRLQKERQRLQRENRL